MNTLVCNYETPRNLGHYFYKTTNCGVFTLFVIGGECACELDYDDDDAKYLDWSDNCIGIKIGTIVEGSDYEILPTFLEFPFSNDELDECIVG